MWARGCKRLLIVGIIALIGMSGIAPVAAQDPAPTVGDIVVDSFDCDTGQVSFHVPVTDLPRAPSDMNPSLGYSITANYDQGSSGFFTLGYDPAAEDSPYTGDVALNLTVPLDGADAMEDASGPLQSVEISVSVGTSDGSGPTDTSRTTYQVACDGAGDVDTDNGDAADPGDPENGDSGEALQLPSTGTGLPDVESTSAAIVTLLSCTALLLGVAALRFRRQS